jgi:hypothetical protein
VRAGWSPERAHIPSRRYARRASAIRASRRLSTRMSSASQRCPTASASFGIDVPSMRSSGAMVAFPPAAWMRSSTSLECLCGAGDENDVGAFARQASAVAAPMPRLAPVTSASLPESGFESALAAPVAASAQRPKTRFEPGCSPRRSVSASDIRR